MRTATSFAAFLIGISVLTTSCANAADLRGAKPLPAEPVDFGPSPDYRNWNGFYAGVTAGAAFGDTSVNGGSGAFDLGNDGFVATLYA